MGRCPPRGARVVLAAAITCAWLLPAPVVARAGPAEAAEPAEAKPSEIEKLYYDGAAAYSASDYDTAIEAFTKALAAASREHTEPRIREALLMNLGKAYEGKFEINRDAVFLRTAKDIYGRLVREAATIEYGERVVAEAKEKIAELERKLADMEGESEAAGPPGEATPAPSESSASTDDAPRGKRARGIALIVSGAAAIGGGVGLIANGARFKSHAEDEVAKYDDPEEDEQDFVDKETRRGAILMGVGGGLAAVGTGLLVWGAVDLARANKGKRRSARVRGGPMLGPDHGGMWLRVGF